MDYSKKPLIGIIMGSSSDSRIMKTAAETLDKFKIKHEDQIVSAHRTPSRLTEYAQHAEKMGFKIIIAGAGGACTFTRNDCITHYHSSNWSSNSCV